MTPHVQTSVKYITKPSMWIKRFIFVIVGSVWLILLIAFQEKDGLGTDFYPLHYAARLLVDNQSPYSVSATEHLVQVWHVPFAKAGVAYPLPAILSFLPILLLPLSVGIIIWTTSGTLISWLIIRLHDDWKTLLLLPCCFMPLHRAIVLKQATLIWFACIVILILAMRQRRACLIGWCIAILPAKPQIGVFFALAGLIWAVQEHRRVLVWAALWAGIIWGASFALQPGWFIEWLENIRRYNQIVPTSSLLPWGLLLLPLGWKLPWYAQISLIQVVLFPLSDIYSTLPLLVIWVSIGGGLALIGSAISWLWIFLHLPNTMPILWLTIIVPLIGARLWRLYQSQVQHRQGLER